MRVNKDGSTRAGRSLYGSRSFLTEAEAGVCTDRKPHEIIRHTPNDSNYNSVTKLIINLVIKLIRNAESGSILSYTSNCLSVCSCLEQFKICNHVIDKSIEIDSGEIFFVCKRL